MAEECKCIMIETLKRMREDIEKNETVTTKHAENMNALITSIALSKQVMDQIQKTQDTQNLTAEKNQKTMVESNNDIKASSLAEFKAMKDEKLEEKRLAQVKKEAEEAAKIAEDKQLKKEAENDAKEAKKWKFRLLVGLWISIFLMALNFGMGMLVKYAPHAIGLGK